MNLIPAIDVIDGQCVRLAQGDYEQKKVYHNDPLEIAKEFEAHGIKRLHLVDLDGAKARHVVNWKVLERIASQTALHIDFGGGVKTTEDLEIVFSSGAKQATAGSIAVTDPHLFHSWLDQYGVDRMILGADLKEGSIATHGWKKTSTYSWQEFLALHMQAGTQTVICTDVAQDGMLQGPALVLYKDMLKAYPDMDLIASGGVSNIEDLYQLQKLGCSGAIIGKAIYEGRISLKELENFANAS